VTAQLKALQDLLGDSEKSSFLKAAHAYPTASFPWNEENMLGLLLRKRLEPDVVTWLETGRSRGAALATPADSMTSEGAKDSAARMAGGDWDELWNWAGPAANEIVRDVYNDEDSEEEDDDDDEDDEDEQHTLEEQHAGDAVSLPLESIMRYTSLAERRIP
jgi:mediator of RNA polymerase II transcription subunit 8, fungi type